MDIRALRYFVELVREKSFTRASEKLFVTQPTISKMIRNMEEELGQPLLNREGHSFTLTDSGQVLFARGQLILAQMQQLEAELADLQSLQHGRLALGIPPMVGHVYADLIRAYRSRYPKVELSIVEYGGRRIEQAVLEGELDLAITMLPTREEGVLSALELDCYPIQVVLPDLPRWRGGSEIRLADLQEEPFLLYTQAFTLSERLEQACQQAGFVPQVAARSSQWDFLTAMVRSGMGVAFLPEPICRRLTPDGLVLRPLLPELSWRLGVIWPAKRYLSRTAEAWLALCREQGARG
ncbi:LysR family transcriptional regulator [Aeromonas media]|uniref:LysR family transcriptional regulator n=1 Tax=Aeromonas media TaxID=651 RepID=A0A7Z3H9C8_AERME|nr:LysR family transcriptional regulator [Aeromonas media]MBS4638566.1 LysR family transcriptional regulator [Aeromonas media]QHQ52626.1 LysR family transcriptional regulator [Aeromonas media]QJT29301.1 LysR family transcriptional regulator [Aeromonas media]QJT36084.1 LysR family transcriptional regulator [Aeromonas media]QJT37913.1 LysR family transcriptional regulator [Aeromonas media]